MSRTPNYLKADKASEITNYLQINECLVWHHGAVIWNISLAVISGYSYFYYKEIVHKIADQNKQL